MTCYSQISAHTLIYFHNFLFSYFNVIYYAFYIIFSIIFITQSSINMQPIHTLPFLIFITFIPSLVLCGFVQVGCDGGNSGSISPIIYISENRKNPKILQFSNSTVKNYISEINTTGITRIKQFQSTYFKTVHQRKVHNSAFTDRIILTNTSYLYVYNDNLSTLIASRSITGSPPYEVTFGYLQTEIIQAVDTSFMEMKSVTDAFTPTLFFLTSQCSYYVFQVESSKFYLLYPPLSTTSRLIIQAYNIMTFYPSLLISKTTTINNVTTNYQLSVSGFYMLIGFGNGISMYNSSTLVAIWSVLTTNQISGAKICLSWVFVSTVGGNIYQYNLNGSTISSITTLFTQPKINIIQQNSSCRLIVWQKNYSVILQFDIDASTGIYSNTCNGSSISPPTINTTNSTLASNTTTNSNLTNSTNSSTFGLTNVTNATNTTIFTIPSNITNSTAGSNTSSSNSSNNNSNTVISTNNQDKYLPILRCIGFDQYGLCNKFCLYKCKTCTEVGQCAICQDLYTYQMGNCNTSPAVQTLFTTNSILNVIRTESLRKFYIILNQISFHNYHNVNYTGITQSILQFMDTLQDNVWVTIKIEKVMGWIQQPFDLPRYTAFTNEKFMDIERSDSFFLQNTKDYFFISVPSTVVIFIIINRIHYLLSEYKISLLIKSFSYIFGLLMALIIQNINRLAFLACHHLMNMFYYNTTLHFLQAFIILFIGLCFILTISYFYLCQYFYGKGKLIFVTNILKRKKTLFAIVYYRYIGKPLISSLLNVYLYNNYQVQIICLSLLQLNSFLLCSAYQILIKKNKKQHYTLEECTLDLCLSIFNFLLYLKHVVYPELADILEECVVIFVYVMLLAIAYGVIKSLVIWWIYLKKLLSCEKKKKKKKEKQNGGQEREKEEEQEQEQEQGKCKAEKKQKKEKQGKDMIQIQQMKRSSKKESKKLKESKYNQNSIIKIIIRIHRKPK